MTLLGIVEQGLERFGAQMLAYCLMGNHDHFVLHTGSANLSLLMRHVNGLYRQRYNRRRGLAGHLLQGRFKAILVDRDARLLEVCRDVELNPVRAAMVDAPAGSPWSSGRSHIGLSTGFAWLDTLACTATCSVMMLGRRQTRAVLRGCTRNGWPTGAMCGCGTTH